MTAASGVANKQWQASNSGTNSGEAHGLLDVGSTTTIHLQPLFLLLRRHHPHHRPHLHLYPRSLHPKLHLRLRFNLNPTLTDTNSHIDQRRHHQLHSIALLASPEATQANLHRSAGAPKSLQIQPASYMLSMLFVVLF